VLRELIDRFSQDCVRRIAAGEALSDEDARAWSAILAAREASGQLLLGRYAGNDPAFDTVTGRCGHKPTFRDC
jgi:hypothetical protein